MPKRKLIQCATEVSRNAVRRESIDGVEHVIISSATLPDDIVMNGIFYPVEEIEQGFKSLARTPAPIGHPQDSDGNFISATDPTALHEYYAGAYNDNLRRENGRVLIDKVVNVVEARKSDRGRRLLDRVSELENSESPRPVHTSVGVFIDIEEFDSVQTNAMGQKYTLAASNMIFDHDAILLDDVGAAQPSQGVGMAVNADGDMLDVEAVTVPPVENGPAGEGLGMSTAELEQKLFELINQPPLSADRIADVFPEKNQVVYEFQGEFFTVSYSVGNETVNLSGIPVRMNVEKNYVPATNSEGDAMRELMLKALADGGMSVNSEITDDELLTQYNALQANQNDDTDSNEDQGKGLGSIVANALAPFASRLEGIEAKLTANEDSDKSDLVSVIVANSDKFGLSEADAKGLPVGTLKKMAANCLTSSGLPFAQPVANSKSDLDGYELPEG